MIPAAIVTGPSAQKQRFFAECAAAFDFLSTFYGLTREQQEKIATDMNIMITENKIGRPRGAS